MERRRLQLYMMIVLVFSFSYGCTALPPCSTPQTTASDSPPARALQQRIKEQEKRIADLTKQLNMLKHLDQGRMNDR